MKKLLIACVMSLGTLTAVAQCITDGGQNTVGITAGSYPTLYRVGSSTINLPPGTYRYYLGYGGSLVLNSGIYLEMQSQALVWHEGAPLAITHSSDLEFYLGNYPPVGPSPICSNEVVSVMIERQSGSSWIPSYCNYIFNVTITEPTRNYLAVADGYGTLYYKGDDYHIYTEAWSGTNWVQNPLSLSGLGWGTVKVAGNISTSTDNTRIYFKGTDNNLYQLHYNGSSWDLSIISCCLDPATNVCARSTNEVYIVGNNEKLYQFIFNGVAWVSTILMSTVDPSSFTVVQGTNDIFYTITSLNSSVSICNLHRASHSPWVGTYLGQGDPGMGYRSDLIASDGVSVYYHGSDNHIHRYTNPGAGWVFDPMNVSEPYASAAGFLTKFPNDDRIFYKSAEGDIYNIYLSAGVWHNYPLDYSFLGAAGDLVAAENKIFYINKDKTIHNFLYSGGWIDGALVSSPANVFGCSTQFIDGNNTRHAAPAAEEAQSDNSASDFDVFPNPSNGIFQLNLKASTDNAQVELVNLLGERVDAFTFSGDSYNYSPAETLAPGIYLLRVTSNGNQYSKKVIVQ